MDYKYINQLLDRYWKAETSLEEEEILRAFFSQDELPAELKPYQALFSYEMGEAKQEQLGSGLTILTITCSTSLRITTSSA